MFRSEMLMAVAAVLMVGAAPAAQPPKPTLLGTVELRGDWKDRSFSAAVEMGSLLLVATDESPDLQIGKRVGADGAAFEALETVRLPAASGGNAKDEEVDLEALAIAGADLVYAVGSHSATRRTAVDENNKRTRKQNRDRQREPVDPRPRRRGVFSFRVDAAKGVVTALPRLDVIEPILENDPILKTFVGVPSKENGVDIEGLAFHDGRLYAGFRGPVLRHAFATVLRFDPKAPADHELLFVTLGGRGIRDLVRVRDGFLVLAGPVGDGDQSHDVMWWDGTDCVPGSDVTSPCVVRPVTTLPPAPESGRSEGLFVTRETDTAYDVLVVYDGAKKGAEAARFRLTKP
jgi:hypothetical protein